MSKKDVTEAQEVVKTYPDCEVSNGQTLKEMFLEKRASEYQEMCPYKKFDDMSDAHGWSAAHCMLATVLSMALLWV